MINKGLNALTRTATSQPKALKAETATKALPPLPTVTTSPRRTFANATSPRARQNPNIVAVQGATGTQGMSLTLAAVRGGKRYGTPVKAVVNDPAKFMNGAVIDDGSTLTNLATQERVSVTTQAAELPPEDTLFINATSASGLGPTVSALPRRAVVLATQNGLDPGTGDRKDIDLHYGISTIVSGGDAKTGYTVNKGGKLQVGADYPHLSSLLDIFKNDDQDIFSVEVVKDIRAAKYEKVALNSALNATCTLLGMRLGQLRQLMRSDVRYEKLVGRIAAEVLDVARARDVAVQPTDAVLAHIDKVMGANEGHPTSMQNSFLKGEALETAVLNGGIGKQGREVGVSTPMNDLMAKTLDQFVAIRDVDGASNFQATHAQLMEDTREMLLDAAVRLN